MKSRRYSGGPPGDDRPTKGVAGVFNPISRLPVWIQRTLGLTQDDLPNRLRVDLVQPVLDFGQQGWGFVDYIPIRFVVTGGPLVFLPQLDADVNFIRRLIYIQAVTDSAANPTLDIIERFPALGLVPAFVEMLITETVLGAAGVIASHADITQGVGITIPPGAQLGLDSNVLGPDTVTVDMLWARFPAGYPLPLGA